MTTEEFKREQNRRLVDRRLKHLRQELKDTGKLKDHVDSLHFEKPSEKKRRLTNRRPTGRHKPVRTMDGGVYANGTYKNGRQETRKSHKRR